MKYVAYYRVSTREQGITGLGLESQRQAVNRYISGIGGNLIAEYQEVESGTKKNRTILTEAIKKASIEGAVLVVKKLDRLSRGGLRALIEMEDFGVKFIESDSPNDNDLIRDIKLSVARDEAKSISERTKSALRVIADKVARGEQHVSKAGNIVKSLGNPQNLTRKAVDKSVEVRSKAAKDNPNNVRAGAFIVALVDAGFNFAKVTKRLNEAGFKTSKNNDFSEVQTKRLYNRYKQE